MNFYFFIFESSAIFAFLAVLWHRRKDKETLEILTLAFVYGMILEALNIHMSRGIYSYAPVFLLEISGVPLCIGAGWAIIFYLSRFFAERFDFRWWQSPFFMALIALSYDVAMDAVAIRLGFWHWSISLGEEWFGVPYDNFFGWLAVVWTFALFINFSFQNFIREKYRKIIRCLVPIISALLLGFQIMIYINLSAVLSGKYSPGEALELYDKMEYSFAYTPEVQRAKGALLLLIILALTVAVKRWAKKKTVIKTGSGFEAYVSLAIHLMFLAFLFFAGIYKESSLLVIVSLAVFAIDIILKHPRRELPKDGRQ
jgi:uncharacterized membrane protein